MIVYNLSRFGRNAREVLNNYYELKQANINLVSLKENMDFSGGFGEAFLTISAAFGQLDNDIRRESSMDGRIAKQRQGKPTAGSLPIGRKLDDVNNKWQLDEPIAENIRWAATEYLSDPNLSLYNLAVKCKTERNWKVSDTLLRRTFKERCGTK